VAYGLQFASAMTTALATRTKDRRGSTRVRMHRDAVFRAGAMNVLVEVRDLSSSGLLVETDFLLPVGECGVLAHSSVAGHTLVRVVRHAIGPTGKAAMGLEVLWQRAEDAARDASGVFAL
jgi:hypothetical protein